jgi:hypothetical protein
MPDLREHAENVAEYLIHHHADDYVRESMVGLLDRMYEDATDRFVKEDLEPALAMLRSE